MDTDSHHEVQSLEPGIFSVFFTNANVVHERRVSQVLYIVRT